MKPFKILIISLALVLFSSCSKDPLQSNYNSKKLNKDLARIEKVMNKDDFKSFKTLLDSLPAEKLEGRTYGDIAGENASGNTVFDRFSKRYLNKNRVKKMGKKLSKNETE